MEREEKGRSVLPKDRREIKRYYENDVEVLGRYADDREEIDPYTYLQVIWRHKKIGLIFLAVVLMTALLISSLTKPMYVAKSTIEISQKPQIVAFQEVLQVNTQDPGFFNTQRDLIKSRAMAEAVISKFDLWDHPDLKTSQPNLNPLSIVRSYVMKFVRTIEKPIKYAFTDPQNVKADLGEKEWNKIKRDEMIGAFLSRVDVSPSEESRLMSISFEAYSPKFAAKMADAVADTFVEWSLDRRLKATREARDFLERQMGEVKVDVEKAESVLHKFSVDNDIVGIDKDFNLIYRQLEELQTSLSQTVTEKTSKESLYKTIESGNAGEILEVINDPLIQQLKGEYNRLLVEYSNLSSTFKPEYPPLKQLQARIDGIRARLNDETGRRVAAIRADYTTSAQKEELLKERVKDQEKLAFALNEKAVQYRNLEREVQTSQSIYDSLLQRFKETDVSGGIRAGSIQVVDHAPIPLSPFKPTTARNMMLALVVGLIGAVGIAFMREFFDRTIRTPEEIREKMRLPVLGGVIKLTENKHYNRLNAPIEKLYLSDPRSPFSEAIRTLRASIMLSSQDRPLRSVLITSCWPGEGKTTIASNLALSLAYDQNRVLLIEADLRHPGVGKLFGIDRNKPGLSNYLMFDSKLNEIIHSTYAPQLFVLPSGSIIPSTPSELLQSEAMKQLLKKLSGDFEYIIIDSSPAVGLADSLMLSTIADGTVIVSSVGIAMQRDITHLVERLSEINARFLGVVINRIEVGREAYFYDRYYKSYYGGGTPSGKTIEIEKSVNVKPTAHQEYQENPDEKGELKVTSYSALLLSLQRRRKTGILDIDSRLKLKIYLQEGFPVFAEGGDDDTLLGSIAVAEGKIRKEDLETALNTVERTKKRIGEVLIGMGFISHHELDRLLEHQVKEKLIKGFQCTDGAYNFKAVSSFIGSILTYKVNPLYVIYEGIKRFGDVKEIERNFLAIKTQPEGSGVETGVFNLEGLAVITDSDLVEKLREIGFSPGEFRLLKSLRDRQDIEYILSNKSNRLSREDILKLLYFLNFIGLIEVSISDSEPERNKLYGSGDGFSSQGG